MLIYRNMNDLANTCCCVFLWLPALFNVRADRYSPISEDRETAWLI